MATTWRCDRSPSAVPCFDLTVHFPDGNSELHLIAFSEGHAFTLARRQFGNRPLTIRKRPTPTRGSLNGDGQ